MDLNFDMGTMVVGVLFGIVGWSAWKYGRNISSARHMLLGVGLMAYAYFVPQLWLSILVGLVLTGFLFWP